MGSDPVHAGFGAPGRRCVALALYGEPRIEDRGLDALGDALGREPDLLVQEPRRAVGHVAVGQTYAQHGRAEDVEAADVDVDLGGSPPSPDAGLTNPGPATGTRGR